mgnify:CR=1 FL=1
MTKLIVSITVFIASFNAWTQYEGNTTPTYPELIKIYEKLDAEHDEIELYNMGGSDHGLPIYLCVINGAQDSIASFQKAKEGTTVLVNNAIHPGEPDGVNACLIWINDWIAGGKKTKGLPVIGIIPIYNVGGAMNRSGTSRANQNGPEEYGFRGNSQNLDLNRDFIKMDSKNMFTFAKIYQALDPDVFIDTHVSNGADYQYTMTYIASVRERMAPSLGNLMHDEMIPYLEKNSAKRGYDLIPYVHLRGETPEEGIEVFNDLPRYAMGYASLMNAISFTTETHMLKAFPDRVQSTLVFLDETFKWMSKNAKNIEAARSQALKWQSELKYYPFNYEQTGAHDSILFKGFEFSHPISEVTGKKRLKYHQDKPFEKYVPYYHTYAAKDSVAVPSHYIVGAQCKEIIAMLEANGVEMKVNPKAIEVPVTTKRITFFEANNKPYEGHFVYSKVKSEDVVETIVSKPGDVLIPTDQLNKRFIVSVLEPETPDSYFRWNYFDSYIQQKEYFSPYVFEDKALEFLGQDPVLKLAFEEKKKLDKEFAASTWDQLYYIYKNSPLFEPTFNKLPIHGTDAR